MNESNAKDQVIDRYAKQRDDFLTAARCASLEEALQELRDKASNIQDLNKLIDEIKEKHLEQIKAMQVKGG